MIEEPLLVSQSQVKMATEMSVQIRVKWDDGSVVAGDGVGGGDSSVGGGGGGDCQSRISHFLLLEALPI
ncbi:Hypothetical predicted protein [Octopus vulgaris]|uniref:Uncharacterized protein n=1 Tax=Octopus vulgaris TaxID=6645 RepID=A0AA36AW05_OCTVU|nr:Hypothetical predicted protein [Octopus vulgaris]